MQKDKLLGVKLTQIHSNMLNAIRKDTGARTNSEVVRGLIEIAFSQVSKQKASRKWNLALERNRKRKNPGGLMPDGSMLICGVKHT